jgi:hypothetical protein
MSITIGRVSARWLAREMALRELFWMNDELRSDGLQVFERRITEELQSLTLHRWHVNRLESESTWSKRIRLSYGR